VLVFKTNSKILQINLNLSIPL